MLRYATFVLFQHAFDAVHPSKICTFVAMFRPIFVAPSVAMTEGYWRRLARFLSGAPSHIRQIDHRQKKKNPSTGSMHNGYVDAIW
ncbi:unnamed protein product [Dibothriocephalus latus]|uniref:Uncharacterized protein n=1 Tax=Dibothriocephalus latus TaxID=60516 RepID=A0A3P6PG56_DIBLA|nr:unnamed protein product [Dibothriocephalus latus]